MKWQFDRLEAFRVESGDWASATGDDFGLFIIDGPCGCALKIIASSGDQSMRWEHVSVSLTRYRRTPSWVEMCFVKDLFWDAEEAVMQLHPKKSEYVNTHPGVLHLWRPLDASIPLPPMIAV